MGIHDKYGKCLFEKIAGAKFISSGDPVKVQYQGISAKIDGVIKDACAVEIESRTDKQIRGALVDLLHHPLSKKLLVINPANMNNPKATKLHCEGILNSMKKPNDVVRVVLLRGTGNKPDFVTDMDILDNVLREMRII